MNARRFYSSATGRVTGVICDQRIALNGFYVRRDYPEHLRRVKFKDPESGKTLVFLTNNSMGDGYLDNGRLRLFKFSNKSNCTQDLKIVFDDDGSEVIWEGF